MARRILGHDWSGTLGPVSTWPPSLTTTVALMIHSPVPMVLLWGPDGVMIYNDAYSIFAGGRHPDLLGSKVREGWPEVADFNDNVMRVGLAGGTLAYKDQELTLYRSGAPEQVWMNLDYSPVYDEAGAPGGVIAIVLETTARVLSERRLAEASARQRRYLEQAPGFVILMSGPDHVVEFVNGTHKRVFGSADWLGKPIRAAVPSLSGQGFFEKLDQVYASGEAFVADSAEARFHRSPSEPQSVRYFNFVYAPVFDETGAVSGIFCDGYDVTETHEAEGQLRESEARLRQLNADLEQEVFKRSHVGGRTWQLSPEIMGVANSDGVFESTNPAWGQVLGWSHEELRSTPFITLVHPEDVEKTRSGYDRLLQGEPVLRFENRYRHKHGGWRWLSWVAVPEGGKYYCSARDITEAVAGATERDRIFAISRDLFAVATLDGRLRSINPAWSKALGRSEADLLSRPFAEIVHPDDLAASAQVIETLKSGQPVHQFHLRLLTSEGEPIAFAWTAAPDAALETGIFYTVGRDITDELAAAAELREVQDALRQSQKMEAVGQLTGGIAHDFNNLLAGISGSLELLQKGLHEGRLASADRYIDAAQSCARRAAALTQRLLAFSRRQTLDPRPTDVNKLIHGMEDLIRRSVGPTIELEVVGAGGLWSTKIDPSQLENAILNLCINARDAMAPRGGRLTIETANKWLDQRAGKACELPPGQYISVCVTDTGFGMSPEVIERAFEPFYTTKPLGQGTGLGLSMIYGFVRQSGGQVRIYSEVGRGTTMCLYLPRHLGRAADEADEAPPKLIVEGEARGETVMVVDDEETIRMLVLEVLDQLGFKALEASDGPGALKLLEEEGRVDLLVTDVGLPGGVNGRQVADAARVRRPDLKVLFITGYAENAVIGNGHLDPGMEVITKPFVMASLASKIRELVEQA
jgi:PAS domain S-box-containing protein